MTPDALFMYGTLLPTQRMGNNAVVRAVRQTLERAGHIVEKGEGAHTIRRSVARCLFDHNVSLGYDAALRIVSATLHHESSEVTERYIGLTSEKLSRDEILRGKSFLGAMVSTDNVVPISAVSV